ncbi:MAG: hypothetical protein ACI93N_000006 [Flavobacteriaceae bacterium]|jgi:hypothetical protein
MSLMNKIKFNILLLLAFCSCALTAQNEFDVLWGASKGVTVTDDVLQKTKINGWYNAGAISTNELPSGIDGSVQYIVQEGELKLGFGLSVYNEDAHRNSISYAFVTKANVLQIFLSGDFVGNFGNCTAGDVLEVKRKGNLILFTSNDDLIFEHDIQDNSYPLYADANIHTSGAELWLSASFSIRLSVALNVNNHSCKLINGGVIEAVVEGGNPPYSYRWNTGKYTPFVHGLPIGKYSVNITDSLGTSIESEAWVLAEVMWDKLNGTLLNEDTLVKNSVDDSWVASTAISVNYLDKNEDGFISYTIENLSNVISFGFIDSINIVENQINQEFKVLGEEISVLYNSEYIGSFGSVNIGDELKIEKTGSTVLYKLNNVILHEGELSLDKFYIASALYTDNSFITNMSASFTKPLLLDLGDDISICDGGSAQIGIDMGLAYDYYWSSWDITICDTCMIQTVTPNIATTYSLFINNSYGCKASDEITVYLSPYIIAKNEHNICIGDTTELVVIGGLNPSWIPSEGLSCSNCPNPLAYPNQTTTYAVTVYDENGCSGTENIEVVVHNYPDADIVANYTTEIMDTSYTSSHYPLGFPEYNLIDTTITYTNQLLKPNSIVQLNAVKNGESILTNYKWSPYKEFSCTNCEGSLVSPNKATTYYLDYSNGYCSAQDSITINVDTLYDEKISLTWNETDYQLSASVSSYSDAFYLWKVTDKFMEHKADVSSESMVFTPPQPGYYKVAVTIITPLGTHTTQKGIYIETSGICNIE